MRLSLKIILAFACCPLVGCEDAATTAASSAPIEAHEVEAKALAEAPYAPGKIPRAFITHKKADPSRMPSDALHGHVRREEAPVDLPVGHPPLSAGQRPSAGAAPATMVPKGGASETGVPLPLPLQGPGSAEELQRRQKAVGDGPKGESLRQDLESLYRLSFTLKRSKRDHKTARELAERLAQDPSTAPAAARVRGFLAVSSGFDTVAARVHYERAIALDPDFGEAHYAMAFLCALNDRVSGKAHYKSAMAAEVEDTMSLARVYKED